MRSPRVVVVAVLVVVAALCCVQLAEAASSGNLAYCEVVTKRYGRGSSPNVMNWVNPVQNATFYTVRSGDGVASADKKTYTPGTLVPIHIRVSDLSRIYIGMVLYATNAAGAKVGTWTITTGLPFWTPASCGGQAVTHSDADLKPIHVVFFFTAPAGTGPVTFQILIKQGEQNKGSFFFPATKLTLTEATVTDTQYVQAAIGQSCAQACTAQTSYPYCDPVKTAAIASSANLVTSATIASMACTLPILSGCSTMAPFRDSATDYCYYHSTNCTSRIGSQYVPGYAPCLGTDNVNERLCGCSATATASSTGSIEPTPTTEPTGSSGTFGSTGARNGTLNGAPATAAASFSVLAAVAAAVLALL